MFNLIHTYTHTYCICICVHVCHEFDIEICMCHQCEHFVFVFVFCFPLPFAVLSTRTHKMGEGCRQRGGEIRGRGQVCLGGVALVFVALPLKCASVALSC